MKAGNTKFDVGTRIRVVSIASSDPHERNGMIGLEGTLTHPFGDSPHSVLGVYVLLWGEIRRGTIFASERTALRKGDKFTIFGHGKKVFTVR